MQKMITILGPTASGKTSLAAALAYRLHLEGQEAEILSGDSRQVYRGMTIGTGKDLDDYVVEGYHVPYISSTSVSPARSTTSSNTSRTSTRPTSRYGVGERCPSSAAVRGST